jgi:hypothetical protein
MVSNIFTEVGGVDIFGKTFLKTFQKTFQKLWSFWLEM